MAGKNEDTPTVRIFGIRHHGPGSALRLLRELRDMAPDVLLVECPADAAEALPFISRPDLVPPVAILLYQPEDHTRAVHLPFARFSPEWVALRYADGHHIPVRPIDLPWGIQDRLGDEVGSEREPDPFEMIASSMGYDDPERWWEYFFEQSGGLDDRFPAAAELMALVRDRSLYGASRENLLREAWMRQGIRSSVREGHRRVAVVCGAFHAPALEAWSAPGKEDAALLAPLKGGRVSATWVPWTYGMLATRSGYGAGVLSPAWYEMLFDHREKAVIHWFARASSHLRDKGVPAPPASVPHAVELATSLACLRGMTDPGLKELEDAALAVLVQGDPRWLETIREELLIGDKVGKVPGDVPKTPLQEDFHAAVKAARLTRALGTPGRIALDLDLRKPSNLLASTLLHRLVLLDLRWGTLLEAGQQAKGNFRERWRLEWRPAYTLRLLECGVWGLTIQEASAAFAQHRGQNLESLAALAALLRDTLRARLPEAASELAGLLGDHAALSKDIWDMAAALSPIIQINRYGETYGEAPPALFGLLDQWVPRVIIGLPRAMDGLSDDQERRVPGMLRQLLADIRLLDRNDWLQLFWEQLVPVLDRPSVSDRVHGSLCRLCREEGHIPQEEFEAWVRERMDPGRPPAAVASWAEGLLAGAEAMILRQNYLWESMDRWVSGLEEPGFREVLPGLRRLFGSFSPMLKRRIGLMVRHPLTSTGDLSGPSMQHGPVPVLTDIQKEILLPQLVRLLGLEPVR